MYFEDATLQPHFRQRRNTQQEHRASCNSFLPMLVVFAPLKDLAYLQRHNLRLQCNRCHSPCDPNVWAQPNSALALDSGLVLDSYLVSALGLGSRSALELGMVLELAILTGLASVSASTRKPGLSAVL